MGEWSVNEVDPMICAFRLSLLIAKVGKLFSGIGENEICLLLVKELAEALVARFSSLVLLDQGIKIIFKEITRLMVICHDKIYEEFVEEVTFSVMYLDGSEHGLFLWVPHKFVHQGQLEWGIYA